jgi:hypothetical protein
MRKNDALIFLGLLALMVIGALFVGLIVGDKVGHARGIREATAAIMEVIN